MCTDPWFVPRREEAGSGDPAFSFSSADDFGNLDIGAHETFRQRPATMGDGMDLPAAAGKRGSMNRGGPQRHD